MHDRHKTHREHLDSCQGHGLSFLDVQWVCKYTTRQAYALAPCCNFRHFPTLGVAAPNLRCSIRQHAIIVTHAVYLLPTTCTAQVGVNEATVATISKLKRGHA